MGLTLWSWYLGLTWVRYGLAYGQAVIHRTLGPYGLAFWAPHMVTLWACPYGQARIHRTLGLYGIAIWAPHGSIKGVLIWACPYGNHRGPLWALYLGPTWVLYGRAHMGLLSGPACVHYGQPILECPYVIHMGPIRACPYRQTGIHSILGLNRLTVWVHMGPLWACP